MCRNVTVLRGLEPPVTDDEVLDAARQFIRKVTGLTTPSQLARADVTNAVEDIARITRDLLAGLPAPRRVPVGPPGRRRVETAAQI